ncbi:MAG: Uma2 family endonuclease [Tepidiformaceae bacterium]
MGIKQKLSVAEYLALPEEKPYLEYICGEAVPKPMPDRYHLAVVFELMGLLYAYVKQRGGFAGPEGRSEFEDRDDPRFLLPDVSYWAPGRETGETLLTPPTLAIEVRSKDQSMRGLRDKCRYYRGHGVDVAWLIDPYARTVEVFEGEVDGARAPDDGALGSPALPGLRIPVAALWAAIDR